MKNRSLIIGLSLFFVGLSGLIFTHLYFSHSTDGSPGMHMRGRTKSDSTEEGRRIYFYGINGRGERIPYVLEGRPRMRREGQRSQMMHGKGLGCVECHREDGKGGRRLNSDRSADIRWQELEKDDFDFKKFQKVVTEGMENGDEISNVMPRYDMTESELNSLIKYLKTL